MGNAIKTTTKKENCKNKTFLEENGEKNDLHTNKIRKTKTKKNERTNEQKNITTQNVEII